MVLTAGLHLTGLKTGLVAFFVLYGVDQVGLFYPAGDNPTRPGDLLDFTDFHDLPP
jgi:hypothetical protein